MKGSTVKNLRVILWWSPTRKEQKKSVWVKENSKVSKER